MSLDACFFLCLSSMVIKIRSFVFSLMFLGFKASDLGCCFLGSRSAAVQHLFHLLSGCYLLKSHLRLHIMIGFMLFVLSSQRFLLKHSSQALIYNATMYEEQVDYFLTKLFLKLCALDRALYEHESTTVTKGACLMEIGKWTLTNMEHFNIEYSNL